MLSKFRFGRGGVSRVLGISFLIATLFVAGCSTNGSSQFAVMTTSGQLATVVVNAAYPSTTMAASNGTAPYTWAVTSGALPTGLTLSSGGVLSGTPTASGTFNFTVTVTDSATPAHTATASLSVTINPALASVTLNPTTVSGGTSSNGTVTLSGAAASAATVTLSSNNPSATVPATATVVAGSTTGTFQVTTAGVTTSTSATITATYGAAKTANLTVNPPTVSMVTLAQSTLTGGAGTTGTITLSGPAATGGDVVTLSSTNAAATPQATVTVLAGAATAQFNVNTVAVVASTTGNIQASFNSTSQTAALTVVPAPSITSFTTAATSITSGSSTTLTGIFSNGAGSVSNGVGAVVSGTAVTVAPTVTTTYTLTVTNAAGTAVTKQATVNVVAAPTITSFTAAAPTITAGTSTTLTGVFSNGTGSIDNSVGAVTSGTAVTVTPAVTTTYTLTVSNAAGAKVTNQATVTVVAAPAITSFTSAAATITAGTSTTLTGVFSNGTGSVSNGVGAVTSGIAVTVSPVATTTYTLTVTNTANTSVTKQVTVTVVAAPVITSFSAAAATITAGTSTTLTGIFSNGTGSVDNGVGAVTNGTAAPVSPASTTTYTLTVTNSGGATVTKQATVTVVPAPVITSFTPGASTIVSGNSTTLTAVFPNGTGSINNGVGAVTSGTPVNISPTSTTTYTLTVTNAATTPATVTATTKVTVNAAPAFTSANNTTFTVGSNGTFTVRTTGNPVAALNFTGSLPPGSVTFHDNGDGTATISGTPTGSPASYPITITANNGVAPNAVQTFTINVVLVQAPAITSANSVTFTAGASGTFTVTTTGSPTPALSKTGSLPASVNFSDNGNGTATISGIPAAVGSTPITITANNGVAPNASQTFTLNVVAAPAITSFTAAATTITAGSSTTLTGVFSGGTGSVNNSVGAVTSGTPATVSPSANTTYTLTVTNAATTPVSVTATATVTVVAAPVITSFTATSTTIVAGNSTTLTPTFSNGTGSIDNGIGAATSGAGVSVSPTITTTYTLTVTNSAGSKVTSTVTITVHSQPTITSANNTTFTVGVNGNFTVTTTGSPTPTLSFTGSLPSPINFVDNGNGTATISGTPAGASVTTITITASNGIGTNATQSFTLSVTAASCTTNCTISGNVSGPANSGVTIALSGGPTSKPNATTDSSGNYSFTGLTGGTYTVTPSLAGFTFNPSAPQVSTSTSTTTQNFTETSTVTVSSITGTVSYAGTKTGLLYIRVYSNNCQGNCNGPVAGTSITLTGTPGAYTGSYTVRGLQPVGGGSGGNASGTYNVVAEIDTLNNGSPNASNPNGNTSSPITVNAASVAVPNIPLTDPTAPAPVTPAGVTAAAGSTFVLLQYSQHGNSNLNDKNGREIATSYKVYYDTNSSFTNNTFVTFAAHGAHDNNYIKSNLATGTTYFFKISTLVGSTEGTASSVVSATTAAGTGTFTVSGKVTFSLPAGVPKATGPLYVGLFDQTANKIYAQVIPAASLTSPQAYSVTNVPAGTYQEFAIIDMNNNGLIEPSDISNVSGNQSNPPSVTVAGTTTSNLTITSAVSTMDITTSHMQFNGSNDSYNLNLGLAWGSKRPVALTLVSGPNIPVPWDMPIDANNSLQDPNFPNGAVPTVGDTYQFQYTFSDGSTQTIPSTVTAVLNSFAQSMAMQTTSPGSPTVPLLTWVTPSSTPSPYTYFVGLYSVSNGTNVNWNDYGGNNSNGIPSGTTNVLFNADGSANSNGNPISSLPVGANFQWFVGVQDNNGNTSVETTTYSTSGGSASSPVLTLSYNTPNPIPLNGVTTLVLFINNPNGSNSLSGIAVSDTLPGGLQVVGTGANNNCGGSLVGTGAGSTSVSLTGASLAPGASCQIGLQVTGTITGTTNNTTGPVTSNEAGTGATSNTATLVVGGAGIAPPAIFIFFSPSTMQVNFSTTLNFYISNPNGSTSLSGVSFTDALPANLFVLSPNNQLSGSCGGGTITAVAGSQSISLSGGTLGAGGASCSFSVGVTATATGTIHDTTSSITSNEGGTGTTSNTASLTVNSGTAPSITTGNTADFFVGLPETFDVLASGSPTPSIAVTGALPSALSFTDNGNGTGVLSGKPGVGTAGGYSPLITASNGVSPNATQTLTLTVTNLTCPLPALGNESLLTGTYVSRFNGFQDANGPSQGVMVFVANGTGGITNGELDFMTALNFSGSSYTTPLAEQRANISASGSCYNLGSDNRGTMVWNLSAGTPITMEFSLRGDGALGHFINFSDVNPSLTGTGSRGSAVFTKRTITGPFSLGNLNGSFAVGLSGFTNDNCVSNTCTGSGDGGYQLLAAVGRFTANGGGGLTGFVFDVAQVNGGGTPAQVNIDLVTPTSASYTAPDTLGRGTLTISGNDARLGGAFTVDYAYYLIDATHFFLQSTDAPINNPLFNGEAIGQSGSFSVASLNGNSVFSMTGGDVATNSFTVTSAGRVTGVGTGSNVSTLLDKISNGSTVSTGTTAITGGTFAVSANGMGSLTIGSGGSAQAFSVAMIGTNSGFIMEGTQASPGTNVMAGLLEPQTTPGGGWTNSAASGLYTEVNMFPTVTNAKVEVGSITFTPGSPSGSLSGTSDKSTGLTCANSCLQLNKSISTTYSIDANGRFTLVSSGGSLIGWLRDTTHGAGLSANNIGLTTQFDH